MLMIKAFIAAVDFLIAVVFILFALSKDGGNDGRVFSTFFAVMLIMNAICILQG